jgi:hypothetical protein
MKQTAVEWLVQQTPNMHWEDGYWAYIFEQAKEMEKQQIEDAIQIAIYEGKGEMYYNETFNKREIPNIDNDFLFKNK